MQSAGKNARKALIVLMWAAAVGAGNARAQVVAPARVSAGTARDASMDDYRQHLQALIPVVEACAKVRDAKTCDPGLVGFDDRVPLGEGAQQAQRLVRYDWLRVLLLKAQEKDKPAAKPNESAPVSPSLAATIPPKRTTTELLQDAAVRLNQDLAQANGATTAVPGHAQEHESLKKVLAGREFSNLEAPSTEDTLLEKVGNGINRFFERIATFSARSPWIGLVVKWGMIGAVCVGLVWGLIQLERRWRIRLVPEQAGPAPGAASARDWQLWLEDARKAAREGRWREAVHFVYWASISRLESKRLWPADRARTPREYLALVAGEDPRRQGLATLTGDFERIWYGGRIAGEGDYRAAEQLAQGLISGGGTGNGSAG
jgi:hypothetical protein